MLISLTSIYSPTITASLKSSGQKTSPEMRISGLTTMLSSLNCPYSNELVSNALETTVTAESRITQVFRCRDICIRIPTHSATTSLTFGTLSSNEPWCIIISEQQGEHRERPTGSSPKDLRQCVKPRARPTKPLPQLIAPGSLLFGQKKTPPRGGGGPTMLISLRSIYNPRVTESLRICSS